MSTGSFHILVQTENNEVWIAGNDTSFSDAPKKTFEKVSLPIKEDY